MIKKIVSVLLLASFSVLATHAQYARTVLTETETQAMNQAAQEANTEKMEALQKENEQQNQRKQAINQMIAGWHNFVLLNGAFSDMPEYSFGITYARVSKVGFYVNAMTNFKGCFTADYVFYNYSDFNAHSSYYREELPFYNGNKEVTRLSASAGVVACLGIPLYAYAGAGYGFRGIFYQTVDNKWVQYRSVHNAVCELGLIGQYKGFSLSVGYSLTVNSSMLCHEAKIGIGYCFKDIKK